MSLLDNLFKEGSRIKAKKYNLLKSIKEERNVKLDLLVGQNAEFQRITSEIEANNTIIIKNVLANEILSNARISFVKEIEEQFEKDEPFDYTEYHKLEKECNPFISTTSTFTSSSWQHKQMQQYKLASASNSQQFPNIVTINVP